MGKREILSILLLLLTAMGVNCQLRTGENLEMETIASFDQRILARAIVLDDAGDLLAVYSGQQTNGVHSYYEVNGRFSTSPVVNRPDLRLTHGIVLRNGFLYASSRSTVYRWPYRSGQRSEVDMNQQQVVIRDIPADGGHITRELVFDAQGLFYVHMGAKGNIDPNSTFARIHRFNIANLPNGGLAWNSGEIFADGVRNMVGLAFDADGALWGVDNGADELVRDDLGGDIHNTNPGDEMIKFDQGAGKFYGYPYCWSVDRLPGHQAGKQMVWPTFMNNGVHSDAWCQNLNNVLPPTLTLPAHVAAIGITFYDGSVCNTSAGALPCSMKGDAFVAYHGSWNSDDNVGYKVVRIEIDDNTKLPTGRVEDIVYEADLDRCFWEQCFRPVDVIFDRNGHLLISADLGLYRVKYNGPSI